MIGGRLILKGKKTTKLNFGLVQFAVHKSNKIITTIRSVNELST
jgi:hypothetical protein